MLLCGAVQLAVQLAAQLAVQLAVELAAQLADSRRNSAPLFAAGKTNRCVSRSLRSWL